MAANLSTYAEDAIANWIRGITTPAAATTTYVGLFTAGGLLEAGTLDDECTGGSYAREALVSDASANGVVSNNANITFTTATAAWGTASHFALLDALTAGNVLMHGALTAPRVIADGDTAQFNTGTLILTVT